MRIVLIAMLMLAGCANPNMIEGSKNYNAGNYRNSLTYYQYCFQQDADPECAYGVGVSYEMLGDVNSAKNWYSLAARYGNTHAISRLTQQGWAVPTPDLSNNANGGSSPLGQALHSYNEDQDRKRQDENRSPVHTNCTNIGGGQINCTSY